MPRVSCIFFPFCGDGEVDLGESGREVGRSVMEGGAGVIDGDAYKLSVSLVSSEGAKKGSVLIGLLGELLSVAEVPAKTDLEEDEGAILGVEGFGVWTVVG